MNNLIALSADAKFPVSGRELHERLQVDTRYNDWFSRQCEYGFIEGTDFYPKMSKSTGGRPAQDHNLTISMAKEICMLQRTDAGRAIRRYLITVEEQWNRPEAVMARALHMANDTIAKLNGRVLELHDANIQKEQIIGELKPKADYVDYILSSDGTMATSQIAADYSLSANRLNRILHDAGIQHKVSGQWILYAAHMGKGYTKSETIPITRSDGRADTKMFTRWTQKGRLMINRVLNENGIYANMDIPGGLLTQV